MSGNSVITVKKFSVLTTIFLLILSLFLIIIWSRQIILSSLLGIGLAVITVPGIEWLTQKTKIPKGLSTVIFYISGIAIFCIILASLIWISYEQFTELSNRLPQISEKLEATLNPILNKIGGKQSVMQEIKLSSSFKGIFITLVSALQIGFESIAAISLSFIVSFYICLNSKFYIRQLIILFPKEKQKYINNLLIELAKCLRHWFKAQSIDMLIISLITTFGLWLVNFQYWLAIGLLTGVVCIIPYLGILAIAAVAALVSITQEPYQMASVLLVFFLTQQIEGNFILPKLMRENVSLPEVPLIIFIILMGFWFGILGVIMAPGILAIAFTWINFNRNKDRKIFYVEPI